jgi:predicted  nucleic acid-binding Zn-ribbon protein
MAEMEFGGMTFRGGKMMVILTALSTLGGAAWGGFEFYKDYMDMREIVQNVDVDEIAAANDLQLQKLNDAIAYTQEIRQDLADDVSRIEGQFVLLEEQVQRAEKTVRALRNDVYTKLDTFEERFRLTLKDNQDTMADLRDKISTNLEESEARIKTTQASIGNTLESIRNDMNEQQKDVTASIREIEASARLLDKDIRNDMKALDKEIFERLQEALDNPLSNRQ